MSRFVFARHRHQYLVTRALLRSTLSHYVPSVAPQSWVFSSNAWGKPTILAPSVPIAFNLSHTDKLIVLAVTLESTIGIDVEPLQRSIDLEIADRFFSPQEVRDLFCLSPVERPRGFIELWTLKEAYIKARGQGLSIALDSFSFTFASSGRIDFECETVRHQDLSRWHFWQWMSGPFALALCCLVPQARQEMLISLFETVPGQHCKPLTLLIYRSSPGSIIAAAASAS